MTTSLEETAAALAAHFAEGLGFPVFDWPILDPTPTAGSIWPGTHTSFIEPAGFRTEDLSWVLVTHQAAADIKNDVASFYKWADQLPGLCRSFTHADLSGLRLLRTLEPRLAGSGKTTSFIGQFDITVTRSNC